MSVDTLINKSKVRIGNVNPVVWKYGKDLIRLAYSKGLYIMFSDGNRTCAEQNDLYAQGRTKPGDIVTNAKCDQSLHNYGIALDMFVTNKSGTTASWNTAKLNQAGKLAESIGFEWGGRWTSIIDRPHIQMTGGLSLAQLQSGKKPGLTYKKGTKPTGSSSNSTIKTLQQNLKKLGYSPGTIDGFDGPNTQKAVKRFQNAEGLKVDGIAGKDTKAEIKRILAGGLTMSEAKKINARLDKIEKRIKGKANAPSDKQTPDDSHKKYFEMAKALGLLNGKDPYKPVSRQQLATVIVRKFFPDINPEEYAKKSIEWAQEHDISDGSNPAHPASRQQTITIVHSAVEYTLDQVEKMIDEKISEEREEGKPEISE